MGFIDDARKELMHGDCEPKAKSDTPIPDVIANEVGEIIFKQATEALRRLIREKKFSVAHGEKMPVKKLFGKTEYRQVTPDTYSYGSWYSMSYDFSRCRTDVPHKWIKSPYICEVNNPSSDYSRYISCRNRNDLVKVLEAVKRCAVSEGLNCRYEIKGQNFMGFGSFSVYLSLKCDKNGNF